MSDSLGQNHSPLSRSYPIGAGMGSTFPELSASRTVPIASEPSSRYSIITLSLWSLRSDTSISLPCLLRSKTFSLLPKSGYCCGNSSGLNFLDSESASGFPKPFPLLRPDRCGLNRTPSFPFGASGRAAAVVGPHPD